MVCADISRQESDSIVERVVSTPYPVLPKPNPTWERTLRKERFCKRFEALPSGSWSTFHETESVPDFGKFLWQKRYFIEMTSIKFFQVHFPVDVYHLSFCCPRLWEKGLRKESILFVEREWWSKRVTGGGWSWIDNVIICKYKSVEIISRSHVPRMWSAKELSAAHTRDLLFVTLVLGHRPKQLGLPHETFLVLLFWSFLEK